MRVLFFNYEYPPLGGGAGNATKYLMQEFARRADVEIDVVASSADNYFQVEKLGGGVTLYRVPIGNKRKSLRCQSPKDILKYTWKAWRHARVLVHKNQYDLAHAFFTVPCGALSWWLWRTKRIPYIVSLRGSDVPGYNESYSTLYTLLKPLVKSIWKNAAYVISNSNGLKRLALETLPEQKINVIYNGVDIEAFQRKGTFKDTLKGTQDCTILCASRLMKRKGFRYAISAMHLLAKKYPHVRLVIAGGEGDASEQLRRQVSAMKLERQITFTGEYSQTELARLQQNADIFLLPSLNEGMSNSLLEAMASGLPVLMTPTGGAEELIKNGENGYIIPFRDAKDIAEKLEKLARHADLRNRMGQESRKIAEKMSWKHGAEEYEKIYESMV